MRVYVKKPRGSSSVKISHDWCDKTTWYQGSVEVTGETLTKDLLLNKYYSDNENWIDLTHGKLYDEDSLADRKEPVVYVNGSPVSSGFTIDYKNGIVDFSGPAGGTVSVDYWYADSSVMTFAPEEGKTMVIEHAELQCTKDISITGALNFEIWVTNPADPPNKILYKRTRYNNVKDLIASGNLGQGAIPACDVLTKDVIVFPFNYLTVKPFKSSDGAELRISVEGDLELGGEWATATFYVLSEES